MRTLTRALFGAAVLATAVPVAGAPAYAVAPPAIVERSVPATPATDPCGDALIQFFAAYALYNVTLVLCPLACLPMVVAAAEMVVEASGRVLQECAF